MVKDVSDKEGFDANVVKEALDALLLVLPGEPTDAADTLSKPKRTQLRKAVGHLIEMLREFHVALDPIHHPLNVLDPSDPHVIGQLIADTLLVQPRKPLSEVADERFYGSGVYAIYYHGGFDAYKPASGAETPLYVGKVDPKTPGAETVEQQGLKLYGRLVGDHAKSIRTVENLELSDFDCRYLVVKSAWQNTAETYLIDRFKPIWNNEVGICYGIGKHGDSAKTRSNKRSPWDMLHPGRPWARDNDSNLKSVDQIKVEIVNHYRQHPPKK